MMADAVLASLTPQRAGELYGRTADLISDTATPERAAFYLYRAGRWSDALDALTEAAETAEEIAPTQAAELWDQAARAAEHLKDTNASAKAKERAARLRSPATRGENWRPTQPAAGG
jgi:hypothetical protein